MKKRVMLKVKLLRISIALIALFTATVFFVTDVKVNNLVDKGISAKLDCISNLGIDIIESKYGNEWNVRDGKLFIGENQVTDNIKVVDEIKEKTGSLAAIFIGDEIAVTSVLDKNGRRAVGTKVSDEVAEKVLKEGVAYEGTADVIDQKYAVKYVPIKSNAGKVIGIWFVGMPKSYVSGQIFAMRVSIIVICILCGMVGIALLMLYAKKFLSGIDTLKVSFLESGSNTNRTQNRVLKMSLFLIGTFLMIWVPVQGFTVGNVVKNLEDNNIADRLNISSEFGYMLVDEQYKGDWSIQDKKLYKGENSLNDSFMLVDRVSSNTESVLAIFRGDTIVATNVLKTDGTRIIGNKASSEVVETVLKQGRTYTGEATVADQNCIATYAPLKDSGGKTIGMWAVGIEKKSSLKQIANLRKAISQISILAIVIAFVAFLFLSIKMTTDIKNFNVSLHTNVN